MRAQTLGRLLGIGVRVLGRVGGYRTSDAPAVRRIPLAAQQATARAVRREPVAVVRGVRQGLGSFWQSLKRAASVVMLQVVGVFFLLPAVVYAPVLWRYRQSWASGAGHREFVVAAILVPLFAYLSASSFWRARRKLR